MSRTIKKSTVTDLTEGSVAKHILRFFLPTLLGCLFQQFYSMVDTIIIGKYLGEQKLAAVGSTGSINFMIIGFCLGICTGFAIPVAQRFGARNYSDMRKYIANSVWLSAVFAVILAIVTGSCCYSILRLLNTPSDIIRDAHTYIAIIFWGIPATILYNLTSSIIRSLGDSKTPVYFLLLSSAVNIVLDLVTVRPWGIAGPAIATVISQGLSGVLCVFYMKKRFPILKFEPGEWRLDRHMIGVLLYMGLPMGLQFSITAIGSVVLQAAVNSLGSRYVAAMTAGSKMGLFFCCPFDALGSTSSTFSGQNVGAGKISRINEGVRWSLLFGFIYSAAAFAIMSAFGAQLSLLFLSKPDAFLMKNSALYMKWNSMFYFLLTIVNVVRLAIQGMGYSSIAILAGIFEMVGRGIIGFMFVPKYGYIAACVASPLAWLLASCFLIPAYLLIIRHLKKKLHPESRDEAAVSIS